MTPYVLRKWCWLFFLLFTLNSCTGISVKDPGVVNHTAYQNRSAKLNATVEWGLVGKISLDDGEQGGSGRLQWDVEPGQSELDFHGALGRGAWHLQITPEAAFLKMADGSEQIAPNVSELIQDQIGWPIPLDALSWWVRGMAAPGVIENEQIGPDGLLISLSQFGWNVDFNRYKSVADLELPIRLNATRDQYRVKLAISRWRLDVSHDLPN